MKTLEQLITEPGLYKTHDGILGMHANPIPNFYGCFTGITCPFCEDNDISWEWKNLASVAVTTPSTINCAGVHPIVSGGELVGWMHRAITVKCGKCGAVMMLENFG